MSVQIKIGKWSIIYASIMTLLWNGGAECLRFDLESGYTKCITEDIRSNSMTVGKYQIVIPDDAIVMPSHKITVRVTSSLGNNYHHIDNVNEGQFAFQAVETGDYMTCFFASDYKPSTNLTIDFDWKFGVAAKDWTDVAKKGSIEAMEIELKKMYVTVKSIHEEIYYLLDREEEMQLLNASTNSKMAWLSYLSIFISLALAGLQLWHLKSSFKRRRLFKPKLVERASTRPKRSSLRRAHFQ